MVKLFDIYLLRIINKQYYPEALLTKLIHGIIYYTKAPGRQHRTPDTRICQTTLVFHKHIRAQRYLKKHFSKFDYSVLMIDSSGFKRLDTKYFVEI